MRLPEEDRERRRSRASFGQAGPWLWSGRGNSGQEPALRPSSARAGDWRAALLLRAWREGGLARVPDQPASHPCLLHSLRAALFSLHLPEVQTAPPPATGPVLDLGFLPYPVPHPRSSPPLPPSPRVWLRWQGLRTLALNQISHFHQDFPILCQTCLGENPYIRMVSDRV